jgi:hypothetical protein
MPTIFYVIRGGAIAVGLAALGAASASAGQPSSGDRQSCFFISQWHGWSAPNPDVLYLGVDLHDVYRVQLSTASPELQWPDVHLVSKTRGSDTVCAAIDLDLSVSDEHGFREPLIATSINKLSPAEVAAIPPKFRPN